MTPSPTPNPFDSPSSLTDRLRTRLRHFLRRPTDRPLTEGPVPPLLLLPVIGKLLLIDLVLALALGGLIGVVGQAGLYDPADHAVSGALEEHPPAMLLLLAVVVAPFFEELIFRFPLRYATNPVVALTRLLTPRTDAATDIAMEAERRAAWDRKYPVIFYGFSLAFAFVHLFNFGNWTVGLFLISPLLVAPQFVLGVLAGFLRVRHGFWSAVLLHALHNFILLGVALLAPDAAAHERAGWWLLMLP